MLAFTPTPEDNCPLLPQVAVPAGTPQFSGPPTIGLLSMLRWKVNPGSVVCCPCGTRVPLALVQPAAAAQIGPPAMPPLSRADQRLQTLWVPKLPACLLATAAVQLEKPLQ